MRNLRVSDIMTRGVVTIREDASLEAAAQKMRENTVRGLGVTGAVQAVGMVVARDIVYKAVSQGRAAAASRVGEVMSTGLVTCAKDDAVEDVARVMLKNNVSRLPVMEEDTLIGIVTEADLVHAWPPYFDVVAEYEGVVSPNYEE